MERSEPSSEVVDVFFRTTSLTPSRPDIVRQGRGREGVGDRSCTTSNTDTTVIALHSTFSARLSMLNHRMQVRHLLCACGGVVDAVAHAHWAGYF